MLPEPARGSKTRAAYQLPCARRERRAHRYPPLKSPPPPSPPRRWRGRPQTAPCPPPPAAGLGVTSSWLPFNVPPRLPRSLVLAVGARSCPPSGHFLPSPAPSMMHRTQRVSELPVPPAAGSRIRCGTADGGCEDEEAARNGVRLKCRIHAQLPFQPRAPFTRRCTHGKLKRCFRKYFGPRTPTDHWLCVLLKCWQPVCNHPEWETDGGQCFVQVPYSIRSRSHRIRSGLHT